MKAAARLRRTVDGAGAWAPLAVLALLGVLLAVNMAVPPASHHSALPLPLEPPPQQPEQAVPHPQETAERLAATHFAAPPASEPAAPARSAALTPPPRPAAAMPAWLRYAVSAPAADGRPRIAIVLDDLGMDKPRTARAIALAAPLTLSFLPYATDLPRLAGAARRNGHELLVHVPMEPIGHFDMGPDGLETGLARDEVVRRLRWDLARFDGYVGINNHMGSKFTSDPRGMAAVIEELKARGLLFLDSRTAAGSVGARLAQREGVPNASRDVFLDNELDAAAVAARLDEVEAVARRRGHAIAIGHPHDATLDALTPWLASLPRKGFALVPVSAIVKERWTGE